MSSMQVLFVQLAVGNAEDLSCREVVLPLEGESWLSSCTARALSCV